MAETISISLNELQPSSNFASSSGSKSVNFGPGADLLMNMNKQKKGDGLSSNIVLDDLTELNSLSLEPEIQKKTVTTTRSNFLFSGTDFKNNTNDNNIQLNVEPVNNPTFTPPSISASILKNASGSDIKTEDDDGYKKFNDRKIYERKKE